MPGHRQHHNPMAPASREPVVNQHHPGRDWQCYVRSKRDKTWRTRRARQMSTVFPRGLVTIFQNRRPTGLSESSTVYGLGCRVDVCVVHGARIFVPRRFVRPWHGGRILILMSWLPRSFLSRLSLHLFSSLYPLLYYIFSYGVQTGWIRKITNSPTCPRIRKTPRQIPTTNRKSLN